MVRSLFACPRRPDEFHRLTGGADCAVGEAGRLLREAGHDEEADLVERKILARSVIPGHWTFHIVEACNQTCRWPVETPHSRPLGGELPDRECHNG
ncbi:hypothetical protein GCM10018966_073650 [Streptomyces yanii]